MKRFYACLLFIAAVVVCDAQSSKHMDNAFLISRMTAKYHVQPKTLNDELSTHLFRKFFVELDPNKIFFTAQDLKELERFRRQLDDDILTRRAGFLSSVAKIYEQRVRTTDSMITIACKAPFNFTTPSTLTVQEDTTFPADLAATSQKLYKRVKSQVLDIMLETHDTEDMTPVEQKKYIDSLEPVTRKRVESSLHRYIKRITALQGGPAEKAGLVFCQALAECYDPHTAFLPAALKEQFEASLGNKPLRFGFSLNEDESGVVSIDDLAPGSPAYKSGQINKGDRITAVQRQGKEKVDVSTASVEQLSSVLDGGNEEKTTLVIRKPDGTERQVVLIKEKIDAGDDDDDKVKSFVLKGSKNIGYISLPAFYTDWENGSDNRLHGCANDVAKEIIKLKKENIAGLILDVRYNGGGSMEEAIELSGIFIDAGPVGQYRLSDGKTITLKDANRGTIYDGPLVIMVNGSSASASEMVAGTLQDYNRAIIVGTPTYGKATAQAIFPLDTTINLQSDIPPKASDNYLKITMGKLFRVNGTTAQGMGVLPDIVLPEAMDEDERESSAEFYIQASSIDANKYYKPNAAFAMEPLKKLAGTYLDTAAYFKALKKYNLLLTENRKLKDISLSWPVEKSSGASDGLPDEFPKAVSGRFAVASNAFDNQRFRTKEQAEMNEEWAEALRSDPYIQVAYEVIAALAR